jgi:adenine-specific DNA-methyltransferase
MYFNSPADFRVPPGLAGRARIIAVRELIKKQKAMLSLIKGLPQNLISEPSRFVVSENHKASVLFDPEELEDWLAALEGQDHIVDFLIVADSDEQFRNIKVEIEDLLGPQIVQEEEKRPIADGFAANLAYFKLDFLDKDQVELGAAFREILPLLWLRAGARGPRPEMAPGPLPDWFVPEASNFAVLLTEARIQGIIPALKGHQGLSHVFIVTDAEEAFRALSEELQGTLGANYPQMQLVQLYRDYLANFMINALVEGDRNPSAGVA